MHTISVRNTHEIISHRRYGVWTQVYGNMYCIWRHPLPTNICIHLIFLETIIIGLHFVDDNIGLPSFKIFSGGLTYFVYFCKSDNSAVQGQGDFARDWRMDRQAFRQTTCNFITALRVASYGNNNDNNNNSQNCVHNPFMDAASDGRACFITTPKHTRQ